MPKAFSPQDKYFHQAKKCGYRARSAFKLEEILQKYKNITPRPGDHILDLGCAPGSFLQVFGKITKGKSKLIGVDLQSIEAFKESELKNIICLQGDAFDEAMIPTLTQILEGEKISLLSSDMAPKTSGVKDVDQWKSIELCEQVLLFADQFLKPNGNTILKIFRGSDFDEFLRESFKPRFKKTSVYKPKSCRDRSVECFLIGEGFIKTEKNLPEMPTEHMK